MMQYTRRRKVFYEQPKAVLDQISKHYLPIVMDDFNAKVRETNKWGGMELAHEITMVNIL